MSNAPRTTTEASSFFHIPLIAKYVFTVQEGLPGEQALSLARCILESARSMTIDGVQNGIDGTQAFALQMLLEMVDGLVGSLEGQV